MLVCGPAVGYLHEMLGGSWKRLLEFAADYRQPFRNPARSGLLTIQELQISPNFRRGSGWGTRNAALVHLKEVRYQAVKNLGPLEINRMPQLHQVCSDQPHPALTP